MPRARKPRIEYYWAAHMDGPYVNWRLIGGNGEIICQSTQGFRDKADARRSVETLADVFSVVDLDDAVHFGYVREVGPGRKPA